MERSNILSEKPAVTNEAYIQFLSRTIGASREEILEVVKRSGISTRRIAEFLVKQQTRVSSFADDE
jgi:hypothetical protein